MILTAFRVENYRSVLDSGWIDVQDVTLIVGKNESGKTSLLKALWKFNPFKDEPYDLSREWPRGRRREMSVDNPAVTVRFEFSPEEQQKLGTIGPSAQDITGVEVQRNYSGMYIYNFLPHNPDAVQQSGYITNVIKKHFGNTTLLAFEHLKAGYHGVLDAILRPNNQRPSERKSEEMAVAGQTATAVLPPPAATGFSSAPVHLPMDSALKELNDNLPMRQAIEIVHRWLPTFIYMDDYKVFKGSAQLHILKQRRDTNHLEEEDRTIIKILEMAGFNLEDEVRKSNLPDKEQRMLDMNDASQTLTGEIAHRWSQKKYEVLFQADGQHIITFVKDADTSILVPLEERSKGFQWFFSFDMTFMYETNGEFKNAIILLDEPGLHLHAAAQRDLVTRIREYAQHNQLIYTTHLPFMIDFSKLESTYVAEDHGKQGTKASKCWAATDKDSRFTLQAAFGLSWAQSLFADQYNLLVEDVADYWLLTLFSTLCSEAGKSGLDEQLIITPSGGASKIAYVGTLLHDRHLNFAVLLNSLPEGQETFEQLVTSWMVQDKHVLTLKSVLGIDRDCSLEDLLPKDYYLEQVILVYRMRLGSAPLTVSNDQSLSRLQQVREALKARGIDDFNRVRVARRIMQDLATKGLATLPVQSVLQIEEVINAINALVEQWRAQTPASTK